MGKILIYLSLIATVLLIVLSSCNTGGCTELRSAIPRAEFYSSTTAQTISIDSLQISGVGAPGDSILYKSSQRLSTIYLPMPAQKESVQWRIAYMQSSLAAYNLADTISMDYDRMPWFAGEECGAMYKYRIKKLDYTRNIIDSVALSDSLVENIEKTNIAIYLRTN